MKYIGFTLSGCLNSIRRMEVSEDEVLLITAGTKCADYKAYIKVVESYVFDWTTSTALCLSADQIMEVASKLYTSGRIHQPRLTFSEYDSHDFYVRNLESDRHTIWAHIVPTSSNTTPAVVAAWEHYRLLDSLTK